MMQIDKVEEYLQDLADELQAKLITQPIHVLIIGGIFMLLEIKNRKSTEDIDFALVKSPLSAPQLALPLTLTFKAEDSSIKPYTEEVHLLETAKAAVAKKHKMPRKWFNDDSSYFIRGRAPFPDANLWRVFNNLLYVYMPSKEYMLALKLTTGRPKDEPDIEALLTQLNIQTRAEAQAIVDRFIPDKGWQEHVGLDDTLLMIFGEEE